MNTSHLKTARRNRRFKTQSLNFENTQKKINDTRVFELDENFLLEAFSKWIPKNAKAYFNTLINKLINNVNSRLLQ